MVRSVLFSRFVCHQLGSARHCPLSSLALHRPRPVLLLRPLSTAAAKRAMASSEAPLFLRLMASSHAVSFKAGEIIRNVMKAGDLGIVTKGIGDLQTEADRSAQRCIVASLRKLFPKVTLIGEEEDDPNDVVPDEWIETSLSKEILAESSKLPDHLRSVKDEDIVVWIDPLDGTSEYTQGLLDHVTVLIGIAVKGEAIGGVIYQPYFNYKGGSNAKLGRSMWGVVGMGVYGFEPKEPPAGQNIITTTRSHSNKNVVDSVQACEPTEILRAGGCGHKVMLILEGEAHAYVFATPGCKKWDTAAPEALVHAMGGKLTDIHGDKLQYHKEVEVRNLAGVLATKLAKDHAWYKDKIPAHVKDSLPKSK